jgi:hypothetical protein
MWPIQLAFLLFIVCMIFLSSSTLCNTVRLHFSRDQSNWSPFFSSTTFQNFPDTSDLLSEVSTFQHHIKLHSKCSTLLVSSLNLSPVCWWKESAKQKTTFQKMDVSTFKWKCCSSHSHLRTQTFNYSISCTTNLVVQWTQVCQESLHLPEILSMPYEKNISHSMT